MTSMTAHHFNNLHPTMRSGRRARTFDHFRNIPQGGVETERVIRAREILVDCLRHADNANTPLSQLRSDTHRIFAATHDKRLESQSFDVIEHFLRTIVYATIMRDLLERIRTRRA